MNPDRTSLDWIAARKRHHISHAQVQMARELGLNPNKLGKLDNHRQELWKAPLPRYIEHLYEERFGKSQLLLTALFDRQVTTLFRDAVSAIGRIALPREIA